MGNKVRDMGVTVGIAAGIIIIVTMALCLIASIMQKEEMVINGEEKESISVAENNNTQPEDTVISDDKTGISSDVPQDDKTKDNKPKDNKPTAEPVTVTPEATPSATPEPTPSGDSIVVAINAAHQQKGNSEKEPVGPGAKETKVKVSYGATGVASGKPEYELTLAISLKLKDELIKRGYEVYMIRETNDVNIADSKRADMANQNADIVLHIHGNATESEATKGVMAFCVSPDNKYCADLSEESVRLAKAVTGGISAETGSKNWGSILNDNLIALNYSKIPAAHVEVGYMTNNEEDKKLHTEDYQNQITVGIADGLDIFFGK